MKKLLVVVIAGAAFVASGAALADKPANPGCFGQDRAGILHAYFIGNKDGAGDDEPGASRWGKIAGDRGSENGDQNRNYKEDCGGGQPD